MDMATQQTEGTSSTSDANGLGFRFPREAPRQERAMVAKKTAKLALVEAKRDVRRTKEASSERPAVSRVRAELEELRKEVLDRASRAAAKCLTYPEAAKMLGMSLKEVRFMVRTGQLLRVTIGSTDVLLADEVKQYVEEKQIDDELREVRRSLLKQRGIRVAGLR